jgi:outer membrane protein assembly factor BamA
LLQQFDQIVAAAHELRGSQGKCSIPGCQARVERVEFGGFDPLPEAHRKTLEANLPLKAGQPLDRALLQASREAALDELKDHGYPYASVKINESAGSSDRQRVVSLSADVGDS